LQCFAFGRSRHRSDWTSSIPGPLPSPAWPWPAFPAIFSEW